jgi:hypothetical protein
MVGKGRCGRPPKQIEPADSGGGNVGVASRYISLAPNKQNTTIHPIEDDADDEDDSRSSIESFNYSTNIVFNFGRLTTNVSLITRSIEISAREAASSNWRRENYSPGYSP